MGWTSEVKAKSSDGIGGCGECGSLEDGGVGIRSSFSRGKNKDPSKSTLECFEETVLSLGVGDGAEFLLLEGPARSLFSS